MWPFKKKKEEPKPVVRPPEPYDIDAGLRDVLVMHARSQAILCKNYKELVELVDAKVAPILPNYWKIKKHKKSKSVRFYPKGAEKPYATIWTSLGGYTVSQGYYGARMAAVTSSDELKKELVAIMCGIIRT